MHEGRPIEAGNTKSSLRNSLKSLRLALSPEQRQRFDARICAQLVQLADSGEHTHVAAYFAFSGEPDIQAAMVRLHQLGHVVYAPVVSAGETGRMDFHQWYPGCETRANRYDIQEPVDTPSVAVSDLDLVLLPLLGFTPQGDRLGMGGGYYDRCFSQPESVAAACLCGVAYSLQQVESIPVESWDVKLDCLISEHGCVDFNSLL